MILVRVLSIKISVQESELRQLRKLLKKKKIAAGGRSGSPTISVTNRREGKIQTAMDSPGRDLEL